MAAGSLVGGQDTVVDPPFDGADADTQRFRSFRCAQIALIHGLGTAFLGSPVPVNLVGRYTVHLETVEGSPNLVG